MRMTLAVVLVGLAVALGAAAETVEMVNPMGELRAIPVGDAAGGHDGALERFGTNYYYINISAFAFEAEDNTMDYRRSGPGEVYRNGATGGTYFITDLGWLPTGALLDTVRLFYYDNDAVNSASLHICYYWNDESSTDVGSDCPWEVTTPNGTPGHSTAYVTPVWTIRQRADMDADGDLDNIRLTCWVSLGSASTNSLRFKGVRLFLKLQISPAPAVATFTDVPTSHPLFQYVEALVASGITAGCTATTYCPDSPLTRGQMAVYLSKALGLHFPY